MSKKEIPHGTKSFSMSIEKCRDCDVKLVHDYYDEKEREERGLNLRKNQRSSFCPKCKTLYINGKPRSSES